MKQLERMAQETKQATSLKERGAQKKEKRIAVVAHITAFEDTKSKSEEIAQLALPITDEACWRNNQDSPYQSPEKHLTNVQPAHNGLSRAGIVSQ